MARRRAVRKQKPRQHIGKGDIGFLLGTLTLSKGITIAKDAIHKRRRERELDEIIDDYKNRKDIKKTKGELHYERLDRIVDGLATTASIASTAAVGYAGYRVFNSFRDINLVPLIELIGATKDTIQTTRDTIQTINDRVANFSMRDINP